MYNNRVRSVPEHARGAVAAGLPAEGAAGAGARARAERAGQAARRHRELVTRCARAAAAQPSGART